MIFQFFSLKQIEAHEARVESELHEFSKPLARYADDTDLDEMLRKQERDGDPMLEYLRSKEKTKKKGEPCKIDFFCLDFFFLKFLFSLCSKTNIPGIVSGKSF